MRLEALDRLRGCALVAMLLHHISGWLTGEDARHLLPGWNEFSLTDVAAPAFFVAAGMSGALLVASRRRQGVPRIRITGTVLRRYGLLVPIGLALRWAMGWPVFGVGVLEAVGIAVVAGLAIAAVVPRRWWPVAAAVTLVVGMSAEQWRLEDKDWLSFEVIAGKFPVVTYVGFVLVGVAAVGTGRYRDVAWVTRAAVLATAATVVLLVLDQEPDRYPGDLRFVVPGLAGTAIVYALAQRDWSPVLAPLDAVVREAAAHTLGIFIAHYAIFETLDRLGAIGSLYPRVALPLAAASAIALCLAAPRVPKPRWSPRTGWADWVHDDGRAGSRALHGRYQRRAGDPAPAGVGGGGAGAGG
jgi:surface polysaccharide O-acyltransferase-like enzyme